MSEPRVVVEVSNTPPNPLHVMRFLKECCSECGALTVYIGIVKPLSKCGSRVKGIEVSVDSSALDELRSRASSIAKECRCRALYLWHREGFAESGAELAVIGAIAMTRHDVLEAVRRAIELIKSFEAIRRREITLE